MDKTDKVIKAIRAYVKLLAMLVGRDEAVRIVASLVETIEDV